MRVYPEPAPRVEDARQHMFGVGHAMLDTTLEASRTRLFRFLCLIFPRRCLLAILIFGFADNAGLPSALAHENGADLARARVFQRSDARCGDQPSEWGGVTLRAGDPATQTIIERAPGSVREGRSEADIVRFGERAVSRPLIETIVRASESTGVDPAYMMALADKESRFDTDVKASSSSAQGLFQFVSGTWLEMIRDYGAKHGLAAEAAALSKRGGGKATRRRILAMRNDPYIAGLMAGEMVNRDRVRIEGRIGRTLKTTELYLAHFLGTADASRFLSLKEEAPEQSARASFERAARANRTIFTQHGRSLTVAEVHERLDDMIDRRLSQFQTVAQVAAGEESVDDLSRLDARLLLRPDIVPSVAAPVVQ